MGRRLILAAAIAATTLFTAEIDAKTTRSPAQVRAFRQFNPCPATGKTRGACPGWHVDHIIALCAGGQDAPQNMQWITREDHRFKTMVDVKECAKQRRPQPTQTH